MGRCVAAAAGRAGAGAGGGVRRRAVAGHGACAGLAVLGLRPMDTSQYAAMGASRGGYLAALAVLLVLSAGLPLWLWGSFAPLAAAAGYGLAVWYGYRNLDGMSGDISGFALTLGELCGCAAAILWR